MMKKITLFFAILLMSVCFSVFCTGCRTYEAARQAAQQTAADLKDIDKKLNELYERYKVVKKEYDDAVASKDPDKVKAASELLLKIAAEVAAQKELYDQGKVALENAIKRAEDAKGTDEFVGNILGTILGTLGSVFGLGGVGFALNTSSKNRVMESAVKKTAANVDTHVSEEEWEKFTKAMRDSLSTAEQDALNRATGKDALLS
jgi:hypothetical protein